MPVLKMTPEVVQSVQPNSIAQEIIRNAAMKFGEWDDYSQHNFGSAWYVELPSFVNKLVDAGRLEEAREKVEQCFASGWITEEIDKMARE